MSKFRPGKFHPSNCCCICADALHRRKRGTATSAWLPLPRLFSGPLCWDSALEIQRLSRRTLLVRISVECYGRLLIRRPFVHPRTQDLQTRQGRLGPKRSVVPHKELCSTLDKMVVSSLPRLPFSIVCPYRFGMDGTPTKRGLSRNVKKCYKAQPRFQIASTLRDSGAIHWTKQTLGGTIICQAPT